MCSINVHCVVSNKPFNNLRRNKDIHSRVLETFQLCISSKVFRQLIMQISCNIQDCKVLVVLSLESYKQYYSTSLNTSMCYVVLFLTLGCSFFKYHFCRILWFAFLCNFSVCIWCWICVCESDGTDRQDGILLTVKFLRTEQPLCVYWCLFSYCYVNRSLSNFSRCKTWVLLPKSASVVAKAWYSARCFYVGCLAIAWCIVICFLFNFCFLCLWCFFVSIFFHVVLFVFIICQWRDCQMIFLVGLI